VEGGIGFAAAGLTTVATCTAWISSAVGIVGGMANVASLSAARLSHTLCAGNGAGTNFGAVADAGAGTVLSVRDFVPWSRVL
jgi:hypothetical protein